MERSDFIMATKIRVLMAFWDNSFVVRIENLFFLLAVGADLPLSYSMAINCLEKLLVKFGFVELGFSLRFLHFSRATPAADRLDAGRLPAKIVNQVLWLDVLSHVG